MYHDHNLAGRSPRYVGRAPFITVFSDLTGAFFARVFAIAVFVAVGVVTQGLMMPVLFGQSSLNFGSPFDHRGGGLRSPFNTLDMNGPMAMPKLPPAPAGPPAVSADFLRFPISSKLHKVLDKAQKLAAGGNNAASMELLREALVKIPSGKPYIHNLMGVEFVAMNQFVNAKEEFRIVLDFMPHIAANHANYALASMAVGESEIAERELRTALALDDKNEKALLILGELKRRAEAAPNVSAHSLEVRSPEAKSPEVKLASNP